MFLVGYTFGQLQTMFQNQLCLFKRILITEFVFLAPKLFLLRSTEVEILALHIIFVVYILVFHLLQEKTWRSLCSTLNSFQCIFKTFQDFIDQSLPLGVLIVDNEMRKIKYSNKALVRCLSDTENLETLEILKKLSIEKLNTPSPRSNNLPRTLTSTLEIVLPEKRHRGTTYLAGYDEKKLLAVTGITFPWEGQESVLLIVDDITNQESSLALRLADISKEKALATVTHELRTPISVILGMLEVIEKQVDKEKFGNEIAISKANCQLLLNTVNGIIDLKMMRRGELELKPENINIGDVLLSLKPMFERQCLEKSLQLKLDINYNLPSNFNTDKGRLVQILFNLVANAVKFTYDGAITIGAKPDLIEQSKVWFWVEDTGIGIKEEDKARLFKMFGRLESSEKITTHGVGLGLTVSNFLVKLLNQDNDDGITVESQYGVGSKFLFCLKPLNQKDLNTTNSIEATIPDEFKVESDASPPHAFTTKLVSFSKGSMTSTEILSKKITHSSPQMPQKIAHTNEEIELSINQKNDLFKKILVVDDNAFNLIFAKTLLEH